jgi:hypothetical protein
MSWWWRGTFVRVWVLVLCQCYLCLKRMEHGGCVSIVVIDFIGLVYMVPIDAHSVSATMKITTTCSLNAPILKRSGGMFVTDATFQEWQKAGMNGFRWTTVTWHGKSFVNFSRKLSFAATVYHIWQEWNLVFDQIECIIRDKLDLMRNVLQHMKTKGSKELGGSIT